MKLKTVTVDGKTFAEIQDGKPVYVQDDGKEVAFDAPHTVNTISRLQGEAKGHREAKEAAEAALKVFDGLDAGAARDALDKLSKLDAKKLVEAGDMDAAIAAAIKPFEEKLAAAEKRATDAETALDGEMIGGNFARSKFIGDKLSIPSDLVQARFGANFKREDGKVVGYDSAGNKIWSKSRPGELADFDEAMELLIDSYPQKDNILKGGVKPGGGAGQGQPGSGGGKSMTRAQFDAITDPMAKAEAARTLTITD